MAKKKYGAAFYEGSSWYHRVKILQDDGSIKYSKKGGFASEKEAEDSFSKHEEEFEKEYKAYQIKTMGMQNIGFCDYLVKWFEEIFSERIETTTRMVGAYALYDLILPNIEQDIKLRYVNAEYLDQLLRKTEGSSKTAANKCREFMNLALTDAVVFGQLRRNPVPDTRRYPRKKPRVTILSKEKLKVLLRAAADNEWYLEIMLALFCGLRKGEILGLKFSDVNYEEETLCIRRQIASNPIISKGQSKIEVYQLLEKAPKTENSYRILKLPKPVLAEIQKREGTIQKRKEKYGENYHDLDYISCQRNGLPHSLAAMNTALIKLCKRNGLPRVTVHGLRHMYATILLEQGVPLVKISALLGHASIHTTFEYYCSQMDENQRIISFLNNNFVPEGDEI